MKFDLGTLSVFLAAFLPVLALTVATIFDRHRRKQIEKPPQDEKLLRPPGHSLAKRLDELQDTIISDIFWACGLCGAAGTFAIATAQFLAIQALALWPIGSAVLFIAFASGGAFAVLRALQCYYEAQCVKLGLRGEQAVAEALHEAGDVGFRAFHDLPAGDDWNIDHIAVCARGVYVIETKARRRRGSRGKQAEHVVLYDGESLQFPTRNETEPILQASLGAKWVANFLTKRTGETVEVAPLLVLPGWFVENQKGLFAVKAMNANYLAKYLRGQRERIDPAQVRRIIAALDDKCRDLDF